IVFSVEPAIVVDHAGADGGFAFGMGVGGEGGGPGDVTVAGGVEGVPALGEGPAGAGVEFADGEEIGGDVLLGAGESFFGDRKLVHEGEAEILFFGGEVDFEETATELAGGFPTDLAAEAGFVAGGASRGKIFQETKENGAKEVPIFGAHGKERAEPEGGVFEFVNVEGGEITLAGGGDVEAEAELGVG